MNSRLEALARDKESLMARSSLYRMRLRRQVRGVRESLHWQRAVAKAAAAPATRRVVFGVALSLIGLSRAARMIVFAGRIVFYAKLASYALRRTRIAP